MKITNEALNNLVDTIQKENIPINLILKLCNINYVTDLTMIQYNYLLFLIKREKIMEVFE